MNKYIRKTVIIFIFIIVFLICFFLLYHIKSESNADTVSLHRINISDKTYNLSYDDTTIYIYKENTKQSFPLQSLNILDLSIGDINEDGADEILLLTGKKDKFYGEYLVIFKPILDDIFSLEKIYFSDFSNLKPWEIEVCEIDGDGIQDIFVGVHKTTFYYPEKDNRPFFFNFKEGQLVKKWTGSKLRHPFEDVCFVDLLGDATDMLAVVEKYEEKHIITLYRWFGFGFIIIGESKSFNYVNNIFAIDIEGKEYIRGDIEENGTKKTTVFQLTDKKNQNGILILEERGK